MLFLGSEELSKDVEVEKNLEKVRDGQDIKITVNTLIRELGNRNLVNKEDAKKIKNAYKNYSLDYKYTHECSRIAYDIMDKFDEEKVKDLMGAIEENNHQLYFDIINIIIFLLDETSKAKYSKFADDVISIFTTNFEIDTEAAEVEEEPDRAEEEE